MNDDKLGLSLMMYDISQRGRLEKVLKTIYTYSMKRCVAPKTGVIVDRCSHFATSLEVRNCLKLMLDEGYLSVDVTGRTMRYSITEKGVQRLWLMINSITKESDE